MIKKLIVEDIDAQLKRFQDSYEGSEIKFIKINQRYIDIGIESIEMQGGTNNFAALRYQLREAGFDNILNLKTLKRISKENGLDIYRIYRRFEMKND